MLLLTWNHVAIFWDSPDTKLIHGFDSGCNGELGCRKSCLPPTGQVHLCLWRLLSSSRGSSTLRLCPMNSISSFEPLLLTVTLLYTKGCAGSFSQNCCLLLSSPQPDDLTAGPWSNSPHSSGCQPCWIPWHLVPAVPVQDQDKDHMACQMPDGREQSVTQRGGGRGTGERIPEDVQADGVCRWVSPEGWGGGGEEERLKDLARERRRVTSEPGVRLQTSVWGRDGDCCPPLFCAEGGRGSEQRLGWSQGRAFLDTRGRSTGGGLTAWEVTEGLWWAFTGGFQEGGTFVPVFSWESWYFSMGYAPFSSLPFLPCTAFVAWQSWLCQREVLVLHRPGWLRRFLFACVGAVVPQCRLLLPFTPTGGACEAAEGMLRRDRLVREPILETSNNYIQTCLRCVSTPAPFAHGRVYCCVLVPVHLGLRGGIGWLTYLMVKGQWATRGSMHTWLGACAPRLARQVPTHLGSVMGPQRLVASLRLFFLPHRLSQRLGKRVSYSQRRGDLRPCDPGPAKSDHKCNGEET